METIKVDIIQVFNVNNDVRKHLFLDVLDEDKDFLEEELGIDDRTINEVLYRAKMIVDMRSAYEKIELLVHKEETE